MSLRWTSFDGYLAALKHKKRNNVHRLRAMLDAPEITVEFVDDYVHRDDKEPARPQSRGRDQAALFLEVIRVACQLGRQSLNFGITTYDFKASLGAELEPVVYLLKSLKQPEHSAAYVSMLGTGIRQPTNRHRAFSGQTPSRIEPHAVRRVFGTVGHRRDPFATHLSYSRADVSRIAGVYPFCPVFESAQEPLVRHEGREVCAGSPTGSPTTETPSCRSSAATSCSPWPPSSGSSPTASS